MIFLVGNVNICLIIVTYLLNFSFGTTNRLSTVNIRPETILKTIHTLKIMDILVRMINMWITSNKTSPVAI